MSRLIRHEFVGNRWVLFPLLIIPFLLPLGIFYLLEGTVTVSHEMEDPEAFINSFRRSRSQ